MLNKTLNVDYYRFVTDRLWQDDGKVRMDAKEEKEEAVSRGDCGKRVGARTGRYASGREDRHREKEEAREAQAHAGQTAGRSGLTEIPAAVLLKRTDHGDVVFNDNDALIAGR